MFGWLVASVPVQSAVCLVSGLVSVSVWPGCPDPSPAPNITDSCTMHNQRRGHFVTSRFTPYLVTRGWVLVKINLTQLPMSNCLPKYKMIWQSNGNVTFSFKWNSPTLWNGLSIFFFLGSVRSSKSHFVCLSVLLGLSQVSLRSFSGLS